MPTQKEEYVFGVCEQFTAGTIQDSSADANFTLSAGNFILIPLDNSRQLFMAIERLC
jgi:hypothetical protein